MAHLALSPWDVYVVRMVCVVCVVYTAHVCRSHYFSWALITIRGVSSAEGLKTTAETF